jgi:hypothetical protein
MKGEIWSGLEVLVWQFSSLVCTYLYSPTQFKFIDVTLFLPTVAERKKNLLVLFLELFYTRSNGIIVSQSSSFPPYELFKRPMVGLLLPEISFNCDHVKVCYVVQFFFFCLCVI